MTIAEASRSQLVCMKAPRAEPPVTAEPSRACFSYISWSSFRLLGRVPDVAAVASVEPEAADEAALEQEGVEVLGDDQQRGCEGCGAEPAHAECALAGDEKGECEPEPAQPVAVHVYER